MLSEITVDKADLLQKIKTNKEQHELITKEAEVGFKKQAIELFSQKLEQAQQGNIDLEIDLKEPQNHLKEYDVAIALLEWEKATEIKLSLQNFKNYVLDDWSWKNEFLYSNSFYSSHASGLYYNN